MLNSKIAFFGSTILILLVLFILSYFLDLTFFFEEYITPHPLLAPLIFIFILIATSVVAPVSVVPLVLLAATFFGPFITGIYSVIGWTLGGMAAFLIARHLGKPVISRLVSFEKVEQYQRYVSPNEEFMGIILLRTLIPADILSYVLGFISGISFFKYSVATFIGVIPFSFILAYAGEAFFAKNYSLIIILSIVSVLLFGSIWLLYRWRMRRNNFNERGAK